VNLNLKDNAGPIIGIITVVGGFVMMWFKPEAKVETLMMAVLTFYFGSSWGSRLKDEAFKLMAQFNERKKEETCDTETDKAVG